MSSFRVFFKSSSIALAAGYFLIFGFLSSASAVTITPTTAVPVSLGTFGAGTYEITATGIVSLAGPVGVGPNFDLDPDGIPISGVTFPGYAYFNPGGADFDAFSGGANGPAGPGVNLGALIGSLTATPMSAADWFLIGSSHQITLNSTATIYAAVNDTFYPNNTGSFEVTVASVVQPVPLPTALPLLAGGMGLMGFLGWRRKQRSAAD